MDILLESFLSYLISLASGLNSNLIADCLKREPDDKKEKDIYFLKEIHDRQSLKDRLNHVGTKIAKSLDKYGKTDQEKYLFKLLIDEIFQKDMGVALLWRSKTHAIKAS